MHFETEADVTQWIMARPRILTKEYLDGIRWDEVRKYPLDPAFVPVLRYMRDIEVGTNLYFAEMRRTPTYNEKPLREFMERWVSEEPLHGELLERFLGEAGHPSGDGWYEDMKAGLPASYHLMENVEVAVAKLFGRRFAGVHMTFGAVNELSTLNGYQRMWVTARHPVLEYILRGVAREEAMHYFFYWSVARLKLERSAFDRGLNRFMMSNFWKPVGAGLRGTELSNMVIRTLFADDGAEHFDRNVNRRMEDLPGLAGLKVVRDRIGAAAENRILWGHGS